MNKLLCLDAGHGYENQLRRTFDSGATGGGLREADVTWLWVSQIADAFKKAGKKVVLTRDAPMESSPLWSRVIEAQKEGATHYLAIHCNASANPFAGGFETLYRDDLDWAKAVHQAFKVAAPKARDRGIKPENLSHHDRLAVMDFPGRAALIEIGFITNPFDRSGLLMNPAVRQAFTQKLLSYF